MGWFEDMAKWAGDSIDAFTGKSAADLAAQNLQYQKDYNQQIFDREDTAVQRRARDMQAAGFNPMLAAGSPASSSSPGAPQRSLAVADPISAGGKAVGGVMDLLKGTQQVQFVQAQADLARQNTVKAGLESLTIKQQSDFWTATQESRLRQVDAATRSMESDSLIKGVEAAWSAFVSKAPGVSEVKQPDGSYALVPDGSSDASRTNLGQMKDLQLMKEKALSMASQWAPEQAQQNYLSTLVAVSTAGLENQFLKQMSQTNPGLVDGLRKIFDMLKAGASVVGR